MYHLDWLRMHTLALQSVKRKHMIRYMNSSAFEGAFRNLPLHELEENDDAEVLATLVAFEVL